MRGRLAALLLLSLGLAQAHDVITTKITWSKEISRLVYRRCAFCHTGEPAAFSLLTYADSRPWAKAMKEETGARRMPPWQAAKGFGDFEDDRGLTQEEIELVSDWVEGGAPEGDPRFVPAPPKPASWQSPAIRPGARRLTVTAGSKLFAPMRLTAVRPESLAAGASVQVIAKRPDGTVEPLLWIYRCNPKFVRTYRYRTPIPLPAGTSIEMSAPAVGGILLFGP